MEYSLHNGNAVHYEFDDNYNQGCTLHDSSSADSVWLGLNNRKDSMLLSSNMVAE